MQTIPLNGIGEGRDLVGQIINSGPNVEPIPTDKNIYGVEILRPDLNGADPKHGWTNDMMPSPIIWAENINEPVDSHNLANDEDLLVHLFSKWTVDSGGTPRLRWYFQRRISKEWIDCDFLVEVSQNGIYSVLGKYLGDGGIPEDEVQVFAHFPTSIKLGQIDTIHLFSEYDFPRIDLQVSADYDSPISWQGFSLYTSIALVTEDFTSGVTWGTRPTTTLESTGFYGCATGLQTATLFYASCPLLYSKIKTSNTTPIYGIRLRNIIGTDLTHPWCNYFRWFGQSSLGGRYLIF